MGWRTKTRRWNWLFQLGFGNGTICRKAGRLLLLFQCPVGCFTDWGDSGDSDDLLLEIQDSHETCLKNWCGKLKMMTSQNLPFQIAKKHPASRFQESMRFFWNTATKWMGWEAGNLKVEWFVDELSSFFQKPFLSVSGSICLDQGWRSLPSLQKQEIGVCWIRKLGMLSKHQTTKKLVNLWVWKTLR